MRIAYVTETWPPELNGVALTAARTVQRLRGKGHVVQVVRPRQAGDVGVNADVLLQGVRLPMYRDLQVGLPFASPLVDAWRTFKPDLVHVATEGPLAWAALRAARRYGATVTSDYRTRFDLYGRYYGFSLLTPLIRRYLRAFHNRCALTCVPAPDLVDELEMQGFRHLEVHGRGIDVERFDPARRDAALRAEWGGEGPFLLTVGRLAREKNLERVMASYHAARAVVPGTRLVVVGDGPMRAELAARCPDAMFRGHRTGDDLARHFASADLFLFPSLTDTFGNVVLEALASGLPVIAFDRAAANMHMTDALDGRVLEVGDDAGYDAAVVALTRDADTRATLASSARRTALALGWDAVLDRFDAALVAARRTSLRSTPHEFARLA